MILIPIGILTSPKQYETFYKDNEWGIYDNNGTSLEIDWIGGANTPTEYSNKYLFLWL